MIRELTDDEVDAALEAHGHVALSPRAAAALANIRASAPYWAPESRVVNLLPFLDEHGESLRLALLALPEAERVACGVNLVRVEYTLPGSTT